MFAHHLCQPRLQAAKYPYMMRKYALHVFKTWVRRIISAWKIVHHLVATNEFPTVPPKRVASCATSGSTKSVPWRSPQYHACLACTPRHRASMPKPCPDTARCSPKCFMFCLSPEFCYLRWGLFLWIYQSIGARPTDCCREFASRMRRLFFPRK